MSTKKVKNIAPRTLLLYANTRIIMTNLVWMSLEEQVKSRRAL